MLTFWEMCYVLWITLYCCSCHLQTTLAVVYIPPIMVVGVRWVRAPSPWASLTTSHRLMIPKNLNMHSVSFKLVRCRRPRPLHRLFMLIDLYTLLIRNSFQLIQFFVQRKIHRLLFLRLILLQPGKKKNIPKKIFDVFSRCVCVKKVIIIELNKKKEENILTDEKK